MKKSITMIPIRTAFVTSLAVTAAFAVGVPSAGAGVVGGGGSAIGSCGLAEGAMVIGGTAGTDNQVCVGAGNTAIGPSVGQGATVVGPTITAPATIGASIESAGDVAVG